MDFLKFILVEGCFGVYFLKNNYLKFILYKHLLGDIYCNKYLLGIYLVNNIYFGVYHFEKYLSWRLSLTRIFGVFKSGSPTALSTSLAVTQCEILFQKVKSFLFPCFEECILRNTNSWCHFVVFNVCFALGGSFTGEGSSEMFCSALCFERKLLWWRESSVGPLSQLNYWSSVVMVLIPGNPFVTSQEPICSLVYHSQVFIFSYESRCRFGINKLVYEFCVFYYFCICYFGRLKLVDYYLIKSPSVKHRILISGIRAWFGKRSWVWATSCNLNICSPFVYLKFHKRLCFDLFDSMCVYGTAREGGRYRHHIHIELRKVDCLTIGMQERAFTTMKNI